MKRLAIMTGGGDAPGLNAVIRAAVKTALFELRL
jgi:ATP-dependent phosphofructokinase / diphosphate-dependent phosphofructokinase